MNIVRSYIVVDDDPFNNVICKMVIQKALSEAEVKTFSEPQEALAFIQNEFVKTLTPTILFLDINMPTLTGWAFMEQYELFSEEIKEQISIYMLSSSVDQGDKDRALKNKYIKGFISKPLKTETVLSITNSKSTL